MIKIFISLNLIFQKEDDKKVMYVWQDMDNFNEELDKILECETIDISKIRENNKMH